MKFKLKADFERSGEKHINESIFFYLFALCLFSWSGNFPSIWSAAMWVCVCVCTKSNGGLWMVSAQICVRYGSISLELNRMWINGALNSKNATKQHSGTRSKNKFAFNVRQLATKPNSLGMRTTCTNNAIIIMTIPISLLLLLSTQWIFNGAA